ncbi:hypothetical protein BKI52_20840 [marine bacterium AO1-C]|nr:hypothetical protein BKI52_20840 [marine bacterium AO1-C]
MQVPKTKYAVASHGVNIAYQEFGKGEKHLIIIPGWVSNIEEIWQVTHFASWISYISSFIKVVIFDKRGLGLSDKVAPSDMENRIEDIIAVMDATGIQKANFLGLSEGAAMAIYFTFKQPTRVEKLILSGGFAKWTRSEDYPIGKTKQEHHYFLKKMMVNWGQPIGLHLMAPSIMHNTNAQQSWAKFLRSSASPSTAKLCYEMNLKIDVRHYLSHIQVPVLIMHRKDDQLISSEHSIYLKHHLKQTQMLLSPGFDHLPWVKASAIELRTMLTFLNGEQNTKASGLSFPDFVKMYKVKNYIEKNISENITILQLCREFGLNEFKLKTGFKAIFNTSVRQYLKGYRLKTAKYFLKYTDKSIEEISQEVGYAYSNNFSATFKAEFGKTPQKYRNAYQKL